MPEEELIVKSGQQSVFEERPKHDDVSTQQDNLAEILSALMKNSEATARSLAGDPNKPASSKRESMIGQQEATNQNLDKINESVKSQVATTERLVETLTQGLQNLIDKNNAQMQAMEKQAMQQAQVTPISEEIAKGLQQGQAQGVPSTPQQENRETFVERANRNNPGLVLDDEFRSIEKAADKMVEQKEARKEKDGMGAGARALDLVTTPIVAPFKAVMFKMQNLLDLGSSETRRIRRYDGTISSWAARQMAGLRTNASPFKFMKEKFDPLGKSVDKLTGLIDSTIGMFGGLVGALFLAPPLIYGAALGLMEFLKNKLPADIKDGFGKLFGGAVGIVEGIVTADGKKIVDSLGKVGHGAGEVLFGALEAFGFKVGKFSDFFQETMDGFVSWIKGSPTMAKMFGFTTTEEDLAAQNIGGQKSAYEAELGKFSHEGVMSGKGYILELTRKSLSGRYGNDYGDADDFDYDDARKYAYEKLEASGLRLGRKDRPAFNRAITRMVDLEKSRMRLGQITDEEEAKNAAEIEANSQGLFQSDAKYRRALNDGAHQRNIAYFKAKHDKETGVAAKAESTRRLMNTLMGEKEDVMEKFYSGRMTEDQAQKELERIKGRMDSLKSTTTNLQFKGSKTSGYIKQERIDNQRSIKAAMASVSDPMARASYLIGKDYEDQDQKIKDLRMAQTKIEAEKMKMASSASLSEKEKADKAKREAEYNQKLSELQAAIAALTTAVNANKDSVDRNSDTKEKGGDTSGGSMPPPATKDQGDLNKVSKVRVKGKN
jgi:hypothetical protein